MKLYFLRHGIAVARSLGGDDESRPLTKAGRFRVNRIARAIAKLDLGIEGIVSSPVLRALQTAQIVAEAIELKDRTDVNPLLTHGFDSHALHQLLMAREKATALLLVGHEPDFSRTICQLMGGGRLRLKKAGLARVDIDPMRPEGAELVWLAPPKVLVEFGSHRERASKT